MENKQTIEQHQANQTELDICKNQAQEYLNNWKRAQADLVNYKKEESKRLEEVARFSKEVLALELIDAMDNLDLAVSRASDKTREEKEWFAGLVASLKTFNEFLQKNGIEKIKTVGEQFNPLLHEAVGMEGEGQKVTEEYQSGYTLRGKVIRPARVKIS